MIPRIVLHIFFVVFSCLQLHAQLNISTTRADRNYNVGEEMNFILTNPTDTLVEYQIIFDGRTTPIESGKLSLKAGISSYVPFTLNEPGIAMLSTQNPIEILNQYFGVAFSPLDIGIYEECPVDFDSFWEAQKQQLNAIPIDPVLTLESSTAVHTTYRINLANVNNRRVYGYITVPNGTGPFPAVLTLPPAGDTPGIANPEPTFTEAFDAISMSISIHNAEPDEMDPNSGFPDDPEVREEYYYRQALLGAVRSLDYIFSRPDFDGQNMVVTGNSQGGGLSLFLAGIDDRVSLISVANPAFCEHSAFKYSRAIGFPYYNWTQSGQNAENINPAVFEASKYYDAKYFAQRINVPCLMTTGYQDLVCPSTTVFGAINQLIAPKVIVHATRIGHQAPDQYWSGRRNFYVKHLPAFANSSIGIYLSTGYSADAGNDTNGSVNQAISISGVTTLDDIPNNSWPVKWDLISGPGKVQFANANQRATTVQFDQAGTYILRFSAKADELLSSQGILYSLQDYIQITVN